MIKRLIAFLFRRNRSDTYATRPPSWMSDHDTPPVTSKQPPHTSVSAWAERKLRK